MLLPPDEAQSTIAHFASRPLERMAWAHRLLGSTALAPYTLQRKLFPNAASVIYNAVGGVDIDTLEHATQMEVLTNLHAADVICVRDRQTASLLHGAGIANGMHYMHQMARMATFLSADPQVE